MGYVIKVDNASLFIKGQKILDQITVDFQPGTITGIVGFNGSGKTVLFKCLSGFIYVTNGNIIVDGKFLGKEIEFIPHLGAIIENPGFIPYYSGLKNLELLAKINGAISKEDVINIMKRVGLDPYDNKSVKKYSLGMRQRLGMAQALMENPQVLILDEPMNGLDYDGINLMRTLILEEKKKGCTIVLASHNSEDIKVLCDYVYNMEKGVLKDITNIK